MGSTPGPRPRESRQWFKMYPQDFLASARVGRMSAEERGVYVTILFRSWIEDGYVLDEEVLADEVNLDLFDLQQIVEGRVGACFDVSEDGVWRHSRLEEERSAAVRQRTLAVTSGRKGGLAKAKAFLAVARSGYTPSVSASVSVVDTPQSPESFQEPTPREGGSELTPVKNELRQLKSERNLTAAIERGLEPVAPSIRESLDAWAEHELELGKPVPGIRAWMTRIARARKSPDRFIRDVAYSIAGNWKTICSAPIDHDYGSQMAYGLRLNDYLRLSKEDQATVKMSYDDAQTGSSAPTRHAPDPDALIEGSAGRRAGRAALDVTPNTNPAPDPADGQTEPLDGEYVERREILLPGDWDEAFEGGS